MKIKKLYIYLRRKCNTSQNRLVAIVLLLFMIYSVKLLMMQQSLLNENLEMKELLEFHKIVFTTSQRKAYGYYPKIYVVTPTYDRLVQMAELTRLKNTFLHVKNLHWILVEDSSYKSKAVILFLKASGLQYTHLAKETSPFLKLQHNDPRYKRPRGVEQRNAGIDWVIKNAQNENGVIYFADDDNTYSIEIFEEMRWTRKVSVWPVGLVGGVLVESPIVKSRVVVGWNVGWRKDRKFALDMAAFCVNLELIRSHKPRFSINSNIGYLETDFLTGLVTLQELEPIASQRTKVLVWHTQSKDPVIKHKNMPFP